MKKILIPVSKTDNDERFLRYVLNIGGTVNAAICFYLASSAETDIDNFKVYIEQFSRGIQQVDKSQFSFISRKEGNTNHEIKLCVEEYGIDLVIINSDKGGLKKTFFGSQISELIEMLDCSVLSVPQQYHSDKIDRIGFASELYDLPEKIKEIIPLAKILNATIEVFHVYPVFPQEVDLQSYNINDVLKKLKSDNGYDRINLHFVKTTFDNEPVNGIREFIRIYKPDLLVMYHKPKGLLDKIIDGSGTTASVVDKVNIPIMALKGDYSKVRP